MIDPVPIRDRFSALSPHLNERERRLLAATEATAAGYGGIAAVSQATGIAASTIGRGLKELAGEVAAAPGRVRRTGGGRKPLVVTDPDLLADLMALVEPGERGDPMSPLRWTCKSLRQLATELTARGHRISRSVVGELLKRQKFSLQANSKTREGGDHPDRDAQFVHINHSVTAALAAQQPVISVDTKKKELVGDFKNAGREWRRQGTPEEVQAYDFLSKALGRAVPYGIYDIAANAGWVSVGMNLADELGIDITVHHLPPGTSKWNKIEHRLFSFISMNWRAKPLISYRVIVDLISATTTNSGLTVCCELDCNLYHKGIVVSNEEMAALNIVRAEFHGEWNYTIRPRNRPDRVVDS
jgi:hypothetical protein